MKKFIFSLMLSLFAVVNIYAEEVTVYTGSTAGSVNLFRGNDFYIRLMAYAKSGYSMKVYYTGATTGNKLYLQNISWSSYSISYTDLLSEGDGVVKITLTQDFIDAVTADAANNKGGIRFRTSNGATYTITKIAIEVPSNTRVLWEGESTGNLDFRYNPNLAAVQSAEISENDVLKVYMTGVSNGDKIWIKDATAWSQLNSSDFLTEGQTVFELPITASIAEAIATKKLAIQKGSYGYTFTSVVVEKYQPVRAIPGYEVIYDGDPHYIDWGNDYSTFIVPAEYYSKLEVGDKIHIINSKMESPASAPRIALFYAANKNIATGGYNIYDVNGEYTVTITQNMLDRINSGYLMITGYYYYMHKAYIEHPSRFTEVTMSADGLATFSHDTEAVDFEMVDGLNAYTASISGDQIVTELVTEAIPANEGLILQGTKNATYRIPFASEARTVSGNILLPTDGSAVNGYVLGSTAAYGVGFYKVSAKVVDAGKAYIPASISGATRISIDFMGEATGIDELTPPQVDATATRTYYNLMGQRVMNNAKGVVIVNGKKTLNK